MAARGGGGVLTGGAVWDDILTKTNAAWLVLAGIAAGAVKLLVTARGQISDLSAKLAKDRAGEQILTTETSLQIGWLRGIVEQGERDRIKIATLEKRIEDYSETRLNDARALERKEAELVACRERVQEMRLERDLAQEDMVKSREDVAALKETIVVYDGQLLAARVANLRIFTQLPKDVQEQMREHLLKQEPLPKEPPKP